jgi:hypothetical protein
MNDIFDNIYSKRYSIDKIHFLFDNINHIRSQFIDTSKWIITSPAVPCYVYVFKIEMFHFDLEFLKIGVTNSLGKRIRHWKHDWSKKFKNVNPAVADIIPQRIYEFNDDTNGSADQKSKEWERRIKEATKEFNFYDTCPRSQLVETFKQKKLDGITEWRLNIPECLSIIKGLEVNMVACLTELMMNSDFN